MIVHVIFLMYFLQTRQYPAVMREDSQIVGRSGSSRKKVTFIVLRDINCTLIFLPCHFWLIYALQEGLKIWFPLVAKLAVGLKLQIFLIDDRKLAFFGGIMKLPCYSSKT